MKFEVIYLGRDYEGKITDFSEARNSFLETLDDDEYVLFVDDDEEAPQLLLRYISKLKPQYPYYWVRKVELHNNRYIPQFNPHFDSRLISNKVRFFGRVNERIRPKNPHGIIDIPIIHNHTGPATWTGHWYQYLPYYQYWMAVKKMVEIIRFR